MNSPVPARRLRGLALLVLAPTLALAQAGKAAPKGPAGAAPKATATAAPKATATTAPAAPTGSGAAGAPAAPMGVDDAVAKEQARIHFERGITLSDEEAWDAALVEFASSRSLFATRGNTKNLALALRKLQRFDESLDMYETLLREFPKLSPQDKDAVDKAVDELRKRVGTIDVVAEGGAQVRIDERARGQAPLTALRVSAGSHVVRLFKDGFQPYETRVDVLGGQSVRVEARLDALVQSGRLRVTEQSGKAVDVEIDHNVVGKTPWEGPLPPGEHAVLLRGEGNLGTPPVSVPVKLNETASLQLAAEPLESELRVEPQPANATVAIDGISVGRGLWAGRLRAGQHTVEVGAEGFLPERRSVALAAGASERSTLVLERDPNAAMWRRLEPSRVVLGLGAFGAFGSPMGGDVTSGCSGDCSRGLPIGGGVMLRGGYQLGSGLGFGLEVGYLGLRQRVTGRSESLLPVGLPENPGKATDVLTLQGLNAGATAWFRRGKPWGWAAQLSAGVFLANMRDARSGEFTTATAKVAGGAGFPYSLSPVAESSSARYLYVAPEVRLTYRFLPRAEIGLGVSVMVLAGLQQPKWQNERRVLTGSCSGGSTNCVTDGQAGFSEGKTASAVIVLVNPGLSARYEFLAIRASAGRGASGAGPRRRGVRHEGGTCSASRCETRSNLERSAKGSERKVGERSGRGPPAPRTRGVRHAGGTRSRLGRWPANGSRPAAPTRLPRASPPACGGLGGLAQPAPATFRSDPFAERSIVAMPSTAHVATWSLGRLPGRELLSCERYAPDFIIGAASLTG